MSYPTIDDLAAYLRLSGDISDDTEALYQASLDSAVASIELRANQEFALTDSQARSFEVMADGRTIAVDNIGSATIAVTIDGLPVTVDPYPLNSVSKGLPFRWLQLTGHHYGLANHPFHHRVAVVTTQYGWPTMPPGAYQAVLIQAARLTTRPESIAGLTIWGGDNGGAMRLSRLDPDVAALVPVRSTYVH